MARQILPGETGARLYLEVPLTGRLGAFTAEKTLLVSSDRDGNAVSKSTKMVHVREPSEPGK
jgi:hypothetical protein